MTPNDLQTNSSSNGPVVIIGPINSVCFLFQFDKCNKDGSHHTEDGSLRLHICQACYEMKGVLVEHTCHSSPGSHQATKVTGAIAFPDGMRFI